MGISQPGVVFTASIEDSMTCVEGLIMEDYIVHPLEKFPKLLI